MRTKKKKTIFNVIRETKDLSKYIDDLPDEQVYKFVSFGEFSSIAFINYIANKTTVNVLCCTTLTLGKKHLQVLNQLYKSNKIKKIKMIVGEIAKKGNTQSRYGYWDNIIKIFETNKWEIAAVNNHSKILLFDTDLGKYVLETSSNLNENPKIEQFSFEKNEELYGFYLELFEEIKKRSV